MKLTLLLPLLLLSPLLLLAAAFLPLVDLEDDL
jgi:hypothetical protein